MFSYQPFTLPTVYEPSHYGVRDEELQFLDLLHNQRRCPQYRVPRSISRFVVSPTEPDMKYHIQSSKNGHLLEFSNGSSRYTFDDYELSPYKNTLKVTGSAGSFTKNFKFQFVPNWDELEWEVRRGVLRVWVPKPTQQWYYMECAPKRRTKTQPEYEAEYEVEEPEIEESEVQYEDEDEEPEIEEPEVQYEDEESECDSDIDVSESEAEVETADESFTSESDSEPVKKTHVLLEEIEDEEFSRWSDY